MNGCFVNGCIVLSGYANIYDRPFRCLFIFYLLLLPDVPNDAELAVCDVIHYVGVIFLLFFSSTLNRYQFCLTLRPGLER